jgi:hypothetical protein
MKEWSRDIPIKFKKSTRKHFTVANLLLNKFTIDDEVFMIEILAKNS